MFSDIEKEKLQLVAGDALLLQVLFKVFSEIIENNKPDIKALENNMLIGEKYRAYDESKQIVNQAFLTLQSFKVEKPLKAKTNRAI